MKFKALLTVIVFTLIIPPITSSTPVVVTEVSHTPPGTQIWVEGSGFPGKVDFEMFLDNVSVANGTTYLGGQLSRKITIPRTIALGSHNVTVVAGSDFAITEITVIQWSASLSVTQGTIRPGEELEVCGVGYPPNAYYEAHIGSTKILAGATDDGGNFCDTYLLPKMAQLGLQNLTANATRYTGPPSAGQTVNVTQWGLGLSVDPLTPNPGGIININGDSLPPGCLYRILLDGGEILRGGCNLQGEFSNIYRLPSDLSTGPHTLSVEAFEYTGPPTATLGLHVVQWVSSLSIIPEKVHPGMNVTFLGVSFPPLTPLTLRLDGTVIFMGNTSHGGTFTYEHSLPKNLSLGSYEVLGVAPQYSGPPTASLTLIIQQWPLNLSILPDRIHPGSELQISGSGFPPLTTFDIYLDGSQKILVGTTNSSGFLSSQHRLSNWISIGNHSLRCTVRDHTGPPGVFLNFQVTEWPLVTQSSPANPHPGEGVAVTGTEYPPGSAYYIYLDGLLVADGIVGEDQDFVAGFDLPRGVSLGNNFLSVQSSFPNLDPVNLTFQVVQWPVALEADRYQGGSGDSVNITGSGFPPEASVQIYYDGVNVKAAETKEAGTFNTVLLIPGGGDGLYHRITVNASGGYSGPPSVHMYFWLGDFPPRMDGSTCNGKGNPTDTFYVDEGIFVKGLGFPPSIEMVARLIPPGDPVLTDATISKIVTTNTLGLLPLTWVGNVSGAQNLKLWIDVNLNGLFDSNDLLFETFQAVYRPDMAIRNATIPELILTEGQIVGVEVEVENRGVVTSGGSIVLTFGGVQVASTTFGLIHPDSVVKVMMSWDTSSSPVGSGELTVGIPPLPGEINFNANEVDLGLASLMAGPDISVQWVNPSTRELHKGKTVRIPARLINGGTSSQDFTLSIFWGQDQVARREVSLPGGSSATYGIDWDTTSSSVGTRSLSASLEILPYEKNPADNLLVNGTIRVMPPNRLPDVDPHGPYAGYAGEETRFDGSGSFDVDGIIVTYRWDLGDGSWAFGVKAVHVFSREGLYNISLTAVDDDGGSTTAYTYAQIGSTQPHILNLVVYDAIKSSPVTGAEVKIASMTHHTGEMPLLIEVKSGLWRVVISKLGYLTIEDNIAVEEDLSLSYEMMPILEFTASPPLFLLSILLLAGLIWSSNRA